jgi:hypothetical protein
VKTAIISGVIANKPHNGGATWTRLSWALGLRKLGFAVFFLEQIDRRACVDSTGTPISFQESANLRYFNHVISTFGLTESAALIYERGDQIHGATWTDLLHLARSADLLVNISGHLDLEPIKSPIRRKVYIDLDPGFTQLWHASGDGAPRLGGHDLYYTVGENIGTPGCSIPTGGIDWRPIRQPVVLEDWPVTPAMNPARFTTIASWRGAFGPIEHEGQKLGAKVHEFRKFAELPKRVQAPATFEIALDIHRADAKDLDPLRASGWRIVDPRAVAGDPQAFRQYVQTSGAEFSVAQGMYVHTRSGWFSDRTVRYLASGKPALVQDTGFAANYSVGQGLLAFDTLDSAARSVQTSLDDYDRQAQAARTQAARYFDSDKVLGRLVEEAGVTT